MPHYMRPHESLYGSLWSIFFVISLSPAVRYRVRFEVEIKNYESFPQANNWISALLLQCFIPLKTEKQAHFHIHTLTSLFIFSSARSSSLFCSSRSALPRRRVSLSASFSSSWRPSSSFSWLRRDAARRASSSCVFRYRFSSSRASEAPLSGRLLWSRDCAKENAHTIYYTQRICFWLNHVNLYMTTVPCGKFSL